nr:helix-hairpin-helix domain-containing protein [uncultured Dyadobacter sp.]
MYRRTLNALQDFFGISRKEARGALVMMAACLLIVWTPFLFRRWILPELPLDTQPVELRVLDSIATLLEKQHQQYEPKYSRGGKSAAIKEPVLTDFDPNRCSEQELLALGIPPFLARRIQKFRDKGGVFRRKEDLLKIYDFPPALYKRLEPHIVMAGMEVAPARYSRSNADTSRVRRPYTARDPETFDINQCDTSQLIRLRGIGSKLSQRILKFRDALGGFHSADQFSEVYGLDSLALSELRRHALVMSAVRKININTATAEELGQHSYLRNRKTVSVLINYRQQHGPFRSLEELRNVKVLDEATIQKMGPYLSF